MASEQKWGRNIRKILLNTFSNYGGQFISLTTWFFLTPFILHQLGDNYYGLWALVGSVVAYATLLDFGISNAVTKYVAEFQVTGDISKARSLISTALVLYLVIGLIVIMASALLAPLFPKFFNIPPEDQETAIRLVFLSGVGVGIAIPASTTFAVLRGLQRFDLLNLIRTTSTLLQAGTIAFVLLAGGGVLGLAVVTIVFTLLQQIPAIWYINRIAPELQFGWRGANREAIGTVASFSWPVFLIHIGGRMEAKTDEVVIGAFLPIASVASYSLVLKLATLPQMATEQFLTLILPISSELQAAKDFGKLRELFLTSTRITLAVILPVAVSLIVLGRPLLKVWVGESYVDMAPILTILIIAVVMDMLLWPAGLILQGISRHKLNSIMSLCSGLTNLGLSIFLVQRLGLIGVALGTLIPTTLLTFGFVIPYALHVLEIRWRTMGRKVFWPSLAPGIPLGIVVISLRSLIQPESYFSIALIAGTGTLTYFATYLKWGAQDIERKLFFDGLELALQTVNKLNKSHVQ